MERACARARNIERCNGALLSTDEAMNYIASIEVLSRDHPRRVDVLGYSALARTCARARNVERCDGAVRETQEPVAYITRVIVRSLNRSSLVDAKRKRALAGPCPCARNIERGHSAVRSAQDAVKHIVRVNGSCSDCPCGLRQSTAKTMVPWPGPVPAFGASNVVMLPSGARRNP